MLTSSTMSKISTPKLVYQRKRQLKSSTISAVLPFSSTKPSDGCDSAISSEVPLLAVQENVVSVSEGATDVGRSGTGSVDCDTMANTTMNGCHVGVEVCSEVTLTTDVGGTLNTCSAKGNYSSSRSNLEQSSPSKIDRDDVGECSSSGGLVADKASEEISERDICISILKSQGLLDKVQTMQDRASTSNSGISSDYHCTKSCKVCEHMESTLTLLLCDHCEDAFHPSCNRPHLTILPIGEWLCSSCFKKKSNDTSTSNSCNNSIEIDRTEYSTSEGQLGSLEFMFTDTDSYLSSVRIGSDFQVAVPDWRGPNDEASDLIGDPLEVDPLNVINVEKRDATKTSKLCSIGNWIQCQEVLDGVGEDDGTICGKWRRAPLFEVQTDDWECFRCVLWDPAHADCAVAQEIETEEVMRQLKYIDMLRPQLAAKRRKLRNGSQNL